MTATDLDRIRTRSLGQPIGDLDTPALLLDLDVCEANLARMARFFDGKTARLRPHFKNHKCITLARKQIQQGNCVGMTCAKLSEAQVLAEHGFDDVLIANQVLGAHKLAMLAELAGRINIAVAVDHVQQARDISRAAVAAGTTVGLLIEVDIGMGRCGLPPGEPVLALARQILDLPGVAFQGLQAYEGHSVYIDDFAERQRITRASMMLAVRTRELLEAQGIAVQRISGGSSGTHAITGLIQGVDEIQAGTYATMDCRYHRLIPDFGIALTVLARVISARPGEAVIDVGVKGAGGEFGVPQIKDHPDVEIPFFLAEEHTVIRRAPDWPVGRTVHLIPSHACTTCNLHRMMFVHQAGRVVDVWPIEGSGKLI